MSFSVDRLDATAVVLTRTAWTRIPMEHGTLFVLSSRLSPTAAASIACSAGGADAALSALEEHGECAVIEVRPEAIVMATDVNRSFPLYWSAGSGHLRVSDDVRVLAAEDPAADEDSVTQVRHAGFVFGNRTLYRAVHATQADTIVTLDSTGSHMRRRDRMALPEDGALTDRDDAARFFREALLESVGALVTGNPGRQLLVPLSGGVDSRLIVSALRLAGARDVLTFTYGTENSSEVTSSRKVAAALDLPWTFIPLEPGPMRTRWRSADNAPFLAGTYSGNALPHVQDWYALGVLGGRGAISPEAIVLPGHSAVRTLKDDELLDAHELGRAELVDTIMRRHFGQAGNPEHLLHTVAARTAIEELADHHRFDGTPGRTARVLQAVNILGRQSTYILNSARGYEAFGLEWAMPLLDRTAHAVVSALDWSLTRDRGWYADMAGRLFKEVAGSKADGLEFWNPLPVSESARSSAREMLERARLLRATEKVLSIRTNLRHPMAFEAFAPSRIDYVRELIRGHSPFGIFADAFLRNTWNESFDWTSPETWSIPEPASVQRID